jgi:hypothetical protein
MNLASLVRLLVVLVVAYFLVTHVLFPFLVLLILVGVGGGLYLRSASHSDRQRLLRSARRYLR